MRKPTPPPRDDSARHYIHVRSPSVASDSDDGFVIDYPIYNLQKKIDAAIKEGKISDPVVYAKIADAFLEEYPHGAQQKWPPTESGAKTYHGTLRQYIAYREKVLAPQLTLSVENKAYHHHSALQGRGQSGLAGFYTHNNKTYLIKQDNPGTCLAEGCAVTYHPHTDYDPPHSPIIVADTHVTKRGDQNIIVTVQQKFSTDDHNSMMSFFHFLFGEQRNPSRIVSQEEYNQKEIGDAIRAMSEDVKKQLAYAIYTSQVNGDESLHTGQFMVAVYKQTQITKIQRVDMGALGRFAVTRKTFDPLNTSAEYANSGQIGKNYVSYLVQDETVKQTLLELWVKTDTQRVCALVGARFDEQLSHIGSDDELKQKALSEFHRALTKGNVTPLPEQGAQLYVRNELLSATDRRCRETRAAAVKIRAHLHAIQLLNGNDAEKKHEQAIQAVNARIATLGKSRYESINRNARLVLEKKALANLYRIKRAITAHIRDYIESRDINNTSNHQPHFFKRAAHAFRNKALTNAKILDAENLVVAIQDCKTIDEIKERIQQSQEKNTALEKDRFHFLTTSHYALCLEKCLERTVVNTTHVDRRRP